MSLVNQALQKVRAQQAQQSAANGPMPYHMSPPRRASFGWGPMIVGTILLGGIVLAAWLGGIRLNHGQITVPSNPASARAEVARPSTEDIRFTETVKPQDATTAAAEVKQLTSISTGTTSPAPADVPPPVAQAPAPATQLAKPTIEHEAAKVVLAAVEPEPVPVVLPPAPDDPAAKEPVLMNVQTLDVPGSNKLKLMATSHSANGSRAVINNTVLEEGDQIESATVVHIEGKRVQLKIDQKTFTLQMP